MTTIKLKNGSGAPLAGDLVQAEPALDLTNKRLYTEDSGGTVIEVGTNPGTDVTFADNRKAIFGAGSDLEIFHDGSSTSFIQSSTSNIEVKVNGGGNFKVGDEFGNHLFIVNDNGDVQLKHGSTPALKLATTATGIDVTGTVTADSVGIGAAGLYFNDGGTKDLIPYSLTANDTVDNSISLGISSKRFKDLHLSGTAYSNNLLVGKTSNDNSTAGVVLRDTGEGSFVASGQRSGLFNRLSSDGEIINFRKDGTTVGSIGTGYGVIDIKGGSAGLLMGNTAVLPVNGSGTLTDGAYDIGTGSFRFKDLYLSGTANVGGITSDGNISMSGAGTGSRYVLLGNETSAYAGSLVMQAGGGSAAYGGSIIAYGHSHASKAGDIVAGISSGSGGAFRVNTSGIDSGSDVLVVEASGNVLVGHSSTVANFGINARLQVQGVGADTASISVTRNSANDNPAYLVLSKTRSAATGGSGLVQNNDKVGDITFAAGDGADNISRVASIRAEVDGTASANDTPGRLIFSTTPDGTQESVEAMRIDSSGNFRVGISTDPSTAGSEGIELRGSNGYITTARNTASQAGHHQFVNTNGVVGTITTSGSSTTYGTSSDYRLKENVVPLTGATERVKQLNPSRFNFIVDADTTVDGFLAHEVADVVPEAITGTKDGMRDEEYEVTPAVYEDVVIPAVLDEEGNEVEAERTEQQLVSEAVMGTRSVPDYQGIDQSKLVPLLVATIQELEARIAALESN